MKVLVEDGSLAIRIFELGTGYCKASGGAFHVCNLLRSSMFSIDFVDTYFSLLNPLRSMLQGAFGLFPANKRMKHQATASVGDRSARDPAFPSTMSKVERARVLLASFPRLLQTKPSRTLRTRRLTGSPSDELSSTYMVRRVPG